MTERDYGKEIDALREQLENLQDMVQASLPNKPSAKKLESVQVMQGMHPDSRLSDLMEELCHKTEERPGLLSRHIPIRRAAVQLDTKHCPHRGSALPHRERHRKQSIGLHRQPKPPCDIAGDTPRPQVRNSAGGEMRLRIYRTGLSSHEAASGRRYRRGG